MSLYPENPFDPGWPPFVNVDGLEYVRLRDGSRTSEVLPLGNSALYGLVLPGEKVSREHQYVPSGIYDLVRLTMTATPWTTEAEFLAAGLPGLDPLPRGYEYEFTPPANPS